MELRLAVNLIHHTGYNSKASLPKPDSGPSKLIQGSVSLIQGSAARFRLEQPDLGFSRPHSGMQLT